MKEPQHLQDFFKKIILIFLSCFSPQRDPKQLIAKIQFKATNYVLGWSKFHS